MMELTIERILDIASVFRTEGEPVSAVPFGGGHINGTYLITTETGKKYTFQCLNANVFKRPHEVMSNIAHVLAHIKKKVKANGGDTERECLSPIKTSNGELLYTTDDGGYFRMYGFVEGNVYDSVEKPEHFYCAAKAFGTFQNYLSDFPAEELCETIHNFHNTVWRYENLEKAVAEDKCGRLAEVRDYVDFAMARKKDAGIVLDAIANGSVPLRVTHNDTKFNNVLLDDNGNAICVLDLDTVMPGSMLYDFGDSIRFGATHAAEDEPDLTKVDVDLELFEAYVKGYLEALGDRITDGEVELLAFSAKLMTLECGIRFLTDYLEGDTYFKTHFPKQNLLRTATQFKLVWDMERKMDKMEEIVKSYRK